MSDSVRPHRRQPTRLPRPWDSPGKDTGVACHFLLQCMKGKSERFHFTQRGSILNQEVRKKYWKRESPGTTYEKKGSLSLKWFGTAVFCPTERADMPRARGGQVSAATAQGGRSHLHCCPVLAFTLRWKTTAWYWTKCRKHLIWLSY